MVENLRLFAYLNIDHPMVAWEVAIGRVKSSCDQNVDKFGISLWQYSLLASYCKSGLTTRFINELKLEQIRQQKFPGKVSRLKGLYFFKTIEDAYAAVQRWGFPQRKKYISAVNFSANAITEVDSEWITSYLSSSETEWMEKYWEGSVLGEHPLTEILASGIGMVQDIELRKEAYRRIMLRWPTSTPLLASACCGFVVGGMEEIALVKPALTVKEGAIVGSFFISMKDLNSREAEVAKIVETCKEKGELPPIIVPGDGVTLSTTPDLNYLNFKLDSAEAATLYQSIHDGYTPTN